MISTTAFRTAGRRIATTASRRGFSSVVVNAAKNDNARRVLLATAGLSLAVAALHEREVRSNESIADE
jgi:hypothetical protein